ncbi:MULTISPECIES: hypothetical protein [Gordonia]|uniref:Uncharacterized protein n=1 Tax=Gordonia amicalis TaxID=89053 RepID=A0AAE4U5R5_9ACTN|nr:MULTISPECIES: hypothetical protein [Gordonia]MDJ0454491.1 hypothetical protein [Gordonia amicalis]MDV6312765.1 hypothetical protein [Gordonia amicalis]MDV7077755.1 hypothetical protein [Gordonia amicalis]UOG23080.1 hypothetical protein MTX80_09495 [Gordonia amicalis]
MDPHPSVDDRAAVVTSRRLEIRERVLVGQGDRLAGPQSTEFDAAVVEEDEGGHRAGTTVVDRDVLVVRVEESGGVRIGEGEVRWCRGPEVRISRPPVTVVPTAVADAGVVDVRTVETGFDRVFTDGVRGDHRSLPLAGCSL